MMPSLLFSKKDHGRKVLLIGWQVANISLLPEEGRFEVGIVGISPSGADTRGFLDIDAPQLQELLIEEGLLDRVIDETNVFFNIDPPTMRPLLGEVKWVSQDKIAVITIIRVGDFYEHTEMGMGLLVANLASIPANLQKGAKIYASIARTPGFGGPFRSNPLSESRLTKLLTLAVWESANIGSLNEASQAAKMAIRQINANREDIPLIRQAFVKAYSDAEDQPNVEKKLQRIWESTDSDISFKELTGIEPPVSKPLAKIKIRTKPKVIIKKRYNIKFRRGTVRDRLHGSREADPLSQGRILDEAGTILDQYEGFSELSAQFIDLGEQILESSEAGLGFARQEYRRLTTDIAIASNKLFDILEDYDFENRDQQRLGEIVDSLPVYDPSPMRNPWSNRY